MKNDRGFLIINSNICHGQFWQREVFFETSYIFIVHCLSFIHLCTFKVSTENVRGYGTLLQDAVAETKKNFVQILLDFGFVVFISDKSSFYLVFQNYITQLFSTYRVSQKCTYRILLEPRCTGSITSAQCAFCQVRWPCGQKLKSKNTLSDGKKIFLSLFFLWCFRKKTLKLVSLFIFRH